MKKGLTFTVIAQAQSLNYGEGISNIAELKKLTRADGNVYTFASRQCLRYDIVRLASELFNWNLQVVDKSKGTIQFKDDMTIKDSQEMDLFGYMKTSKKDDKDKGGSSTREAVVRLSNAISLEAYRSDMDFLNNKGLADKNRRTSKPCKCRTTFKLLYIYSNNRFIKSRNRWRYRIIK